MIDLKQLKDEKFLALDIKHNMNLELYLPKMSFETEGQLQKPCPF